MGWKVGVSSPGRRKDVFFSPKSSSAAMGATDPPVLWVLGFFPGRGRGKQECEADHSLLVPRFRISGATPLLPLYINDMLDPRTIQV